MIENHSVRGQSDPLQVLYWERVTDTESGGVQRVQPFGKINAQSKWWKIACNLPYLVWQIKSMTIREGVERWQAWKNLPMEQW